MEVVGLEPKVLAHLEKYFAVMLCPNVSGQVCEEVTHMHRCTQTDRHTDTHTQSDTQIHTHGHTHRYTHTVRHTDKHTHRQTHRCLRTQLTHVCHPAQVVTGTMVKPPIPGEASYPDYAKEKDAVLQSLKRKAQRMEELLNAIPGVQCNPVQGAMYAYPSITVPSDALSDAQVSSTGLHARQWGGCL